MHITASKMIQQAMMQLLIKGPPLLSPDNLGLQIKAPQVENKLGKPAQAVLIDAGTVGRTW